jgi:hypothetical protein
MSRITRESFTDSMSTGAGGLDLSDVDDATLASLGKAGVSMDELGGIAGDDLVISGHDELSRLFDLVDRVDRNGSRNSIDTTRTTDDGRKVSTASGELCLALRDEVDKARIARGIGEPTVLGTSRDLRPTAVAYDRALSTLQAKGFTDIHLAATTPYFNQGDRAWATHPYPQNPPELGVERLLREAGCAPCALAMADATVRRSDVTPIDVADFAVQGGFSGTKSGVGSDTLGMGRAWASEHDLTFTEATAGAPSRNADVLRDGVVAGGVGVVSVGPGHFTNGKHVVVVNGYAKDRSGQEWFFIADPGRHDQSTRKGLNVDESVVQDRSLNLGAGQIRISRDQLEAEMRHAYVLTGGGQ